jgi:hypothetical protein
MESDVPMKLVRVIKIYLNETYSEIRTGKTLSDAFPIQNGLKQGNECFIVFAFQFCFRICHQEGLKLIGTHQLLVDVDDVNIRGKT